MKMHIYQALIFLLVLYINIQDVNSLIIETNHNSKKSIPFFDKGTENLFRDNHGYDKTRQYKQPYLQRGSSGRYPDGKDHPCYRNGSCDSTPMVCEYEFHVEWYQSMSKACFDCPFNTTDCDRPDCVMADGINRTITVVNRKMPGPSIEVCQNDIIIVTVTNDLMASGTTIHWHGIAQKKTPFMDGVPFVTQCPIQPESYFVYKFQASQAGTYFWHSHVGLQRGDGVSGALIIRQTRWRDKQSSFYDIDLSDHVLQVFDWTKDTSVGMFTDHYHADREMAPTALLINGRGRFYRTIGGKTVRTNAPVFEVAEGFRYRFRFINAQFYFCPVELSVDDHNITIIATDGNDIQPVVAKHLVAYAGERFDFVINTSKMQRNNYWIRIRGVMNCENYTHVRQVAVLRYRGAKNDEPDGELKWQKREFNPLSANIENQGEEQNITTTISKFRSVKNPMPEDDTLRRIPDHKFYVSYDLHFKNNSLFNKAPFYGHHQVPAKYSAPTPQLNHISMKLPPSPLLVTRPPSHTFCNQLTFPKNGFCKRTFCRCPHVLPVKLDSVVEVIIIDEGKDFDANHPFHLHGHSFRVLGQKRLGSKTSSEYVKALDEQGKMERNFKDPPVKDTVTVPDGGYTIIRFKANNPGYWLFHCHIEFHAEVGMALVFKVGKHKDMVPVPDHFPTCGDFTSKTMDRNDWTKQGVDFSRNPWKQLSKDHSVLNLPDGGELHVLYKPPLLDS